MTKVSIVTLCFLMFCVCARACAAAEQQFLLLFLLIFARVAGVYALCSRPRARRRLIQRHRSGSLSRRVLYKKIFIMFEPYFVATKIESDHDQVLQRPRLVGGGPSVTALCG